MTTSELNQQTQLPHRLTLGDVLSSIELTPGEMSAFLTNIASNFQGGAHHNLFRLFTDHAAMVANPVTYGYQPPEAAPASPELEYAAPSAPRYAQTFGGNNVDAGVASEQDRAPAAQGQATTPQTLRTGAADASRDQGTQWTARPLTPAVGDPGASVGGVPLSDDERRQYSHPQASAMDRAAMQQKDDEIQRLRDELARARGDTMKQPESPTITRPRHFDTARGEWVYNDNNEPVPQSELSSGFDVQPSQ